MTIRERIEDWIRIQKIRPDDRKLNQFILAVRWKQLSEEEIREQLQMDQRTFNCYRKAYQRLQNYICC